MVATPQPKVTPDSPRPDGLLRLYTHNIYARRAGWDRRRRVLIDGIQRLDPDIVVLQEEVWTDDYDQTADIAGTDKHVVHSTARSAAERSGISVASRWPVVAVHEIDLTVGGPPVDEYHWVALLVEVDGPGT